MKRVRDEGARLLRAVLAVLGEVLGVDRAKIEHETCLSSPGPEAEKGRLGVRRY